MTDAAHQTDAGDRSSGTMQQTDTGDRSSDTMRPTDAGDRSSGTMRPTDAGDQPTGNASTVDTDRPTPAGGRPPAGIDAGRQPAAPRRPLTELMAPDWAHALTGVSGEITEMGDFLRAELDAGRGYLPPGPAILRAFAQPMADVRVLIVGQDPYPTPGHAVGLSFSVAPQVRPIPRSLANIYRELCADVGCQPPSTGDLTPWAQRGVMLLNRVLTVRPGQPGSHRGKGWEEVTEAAIRALAARGGPLVAILWGRDAQSLAPMLGPVPRIASAHPSPMSADRGFFGSRPFSRANAALVSQGADPIDWSLP